MKHARELFMASLTLKLYFEALLSPIGDQREGGGVEQNWWLLNVYVIKDVWRVLVFDDLN
jgi:hypothetical protein